MSVHQATFRAHCAIDVVSDAISEHHHLFHYHLTNSMLTLVVVMLVPFNILHQVRINWRQKLALAGIFSLTIFVMITAIIRVTVTFPYRTHVDLPWVWSWSSTEEAVGM